MNQLSDRQSFFSEELLGKLTYTAYLIALKAGIKKPFLEVELELWNSFRKIFKEDISKLKEESDHSLSREKFSQLIHSLR